MKKFFLSILVILFSLQVYSQNVMKIGAYVSPPFIIENEDGSLDGISLELWKEISEDLHIPYEIEVFNCGIEHMIDSLNAGKIDMILGSITINSNRLEKVNFTQPYYNTELAIVSQIDEGGIGDILSGIFSLNFLKYIIILLLVLLLLGIFLWLIEKNYNEQFAEGYRGIFDGFYFVSVVMTTVGFGDKAPKTILGKVVVIIWMFVALGITGIFIGNISSALTVGKLEGGINSISDLNKMKVGSLYETTSGYFLERNNVKFIGYNSTQEALGSMSKNELEAFVYDAPIIRYYLRNMGLETDFVLSEISLDKQSYGFCFRHSDEKIKTVNSKILKITKTDFWKNLLYQYNVN